MPRRSDWGNMILNFTKENKTFGEIQEGLDIPSSTLDRYLKEFIKKGFVEKKYDSKKDKLEYERTETGTKIWVIMEVMNSANEGKTDLLSLLPPYLMKEAREKISAKKADKSEKVE